MDLRRTLYQNIVLSGGSTLFKGKLGIFFAMKMSHLIGKYTPIVACSTFVTTGDERDNQQAWDQTGCVCVY